MLYLSRNPITNVFSGLGQKRQRGSTQSESFVVCTPMEKFRFHCQRILKSSCSRFLTPMKGSFILLFSMLSIDCWMVQ